MVRKCEVCGVETYTSAWHGRDLCWSCIAKLDHVSRYRVYGLVGDRQVSSDYFCKSEVEALAAYREDMPGVYILGVDKL